MLNYDLIVVGAGVSGLTAAYKAAQCGARVALIEKDDFVGGVASKAFHVTLCGFFLNDSLQAFHQLNGGIAATVIDDMIGSGVAECKQIGKTEVVMTYPGALPALFTSYLENTDVELYLNTKILKVNCDSKRIYSLFLNQLGRTVEITAPKFIDASGCSVLAQMAGALLLNSGERQLAALCAKIIDVDINDSMLPVLTSYNARKIVEEYGLFPEMVYTVVHGSHDGYMVLKISLAPERDYGQSLKAANRLVAGLGMKLKAWSESKVLEWSRGLIFRDDKRVHGKTILERDQILSGYKGDGCVKAAWPIEFWHIDRGPRYDYLESGEYYVIPDDCLISNSFENLYTAGKSISTDSYAGASTRVVGTAISTGERAAILALG